MRPPYLLTLTLLLLSAFAAHLSARDAAAHQYVANGGFEEGTERWRLISGTDFDSDAVGDHAEGSRTATISTADKRFEIRQLLDEATPVGTYQVGLDVRTVRDLELTITLTDALAPADRYGGSVVVYPSAWQHVDITMSVTRAAFLQLVIGGVGAAEQVVRLDGVSISGASPVVLTPTATRTPTQTATATQDSSGGGSIAATPTLSGPSATPPAFAITESLQNAGFEDVGGGGEVSAWRKYGGELSSTNTHRSGARGARLTSATDSTKWLFQAVLVEPSSTYEFGAWILHDDPSVRSVVLRISWYSSDDGSGEAIGAVDSSERLETPSAAWRFLHTEAAAAPFNAHSARVRVLLAPQSGAPAAITVDDASFAPAVAPATPVPLASRDVSVLPSTASDRKAVRRAEALGVASAGNQPTNVATHGAIVINEVLYDAMGDRPDADGEWVELYNAGDAPVSLQGWSLEDESSADVLPSLEIPAHGFAIVASSAFRGAHPAYGGPLVTLSRIGNGLGNDGDRLALLDADGRLVDAISWGTNASALDPPISDVPSGHSVERLSPGMDTDAATDFVDNDRPSPGSAFEATAARTSGVDGTVDILAGAPEDTFAWLPWALAAASGAMLLATVAWRVVSDTARRPQA